MSAGVEQASSHSQTEDGWGCSTHGSRCRSLPGARSPGKQGLPVANATALVARWVVSIDVQRGASSRLRAIAAPLFIEVDVTPREKWKEAFLALGFSDAAAESHTRMTAVSVDSGFDLSDDPLRGETTLSVYIRDLVAGSNELAVER